MDLKNFIDATYLLERALHISPEDIEARNNYGNTLFELGNPKKAIQQLKIAQKLSPENSTVSINLGRALLRQGDYTGAIKILDSAILYNPNNAADHSAKVLGDFDIEISCPSGLRVPQI